MLTPLFLANVNAQVQVSGKLRIQNRLQAYSFREKNNLIGQETS
jgi:hypothetical protein